MPNPQNDRFTRSADSFGNEPSAPRDVIEGAYNGQSGPGGAAYLPIADLVAEAEADEHAERVAKTPPSLPDAALSQDNPLGSSYIREPRANLEGLAGNREDPSVLPIDYPEFLEDGSDQNS